MNRPILYSFRRCPYAMRARMALMISGESVTLREVLLRDKPAAMIEASPKATVPVLVKGEGDVLDESLAIMMWSLGRHDPEGWLGEGDEALARMRALIAENDGPFKHHLDRYKYSARYEDADAGEHRAEGLTFLERLNERLEQTAHLFGERRKLADIAIFPFVRQFRIADPAWFDALPLAPLKRWLEAHMESALFRSVMEKYAVWEPGDAGVAFASAQSR